MKNLLYAFLFLFSNFAYAQITFEKGYIIDNNGEKKDVLIKNNEWKNNPNLIEYKTSETSKIIQVSTSQIREFYVGEQKYVIANVMLDRSSNKLEDLSISKNFNNKEETLPLKVIVEGKVSLYAYYDDFVIRFFYKRENENSYEQLNYKEYLVDSSHTSKNEDYKYQLKKEFGDNKKINISDLERLSYKENNLKKLFYKYNDLNESPSTKKRDRFHLYIKPGIGLSKYEILSKVENHTTTSPIFKLGFEFEYVLNFNKGKWNIISEPSFQTLDIKVNDYNRRNFEIKYSSIQIPFGIKYNMFINQKSKIYLSPSLFYDMILNKDNFTVDNIYSQVNSTVAFNFAIGYNYDKFGTEIKWGSVPSFSSGYYGPPHDMKLNSFNLSFSYKLF